MGCNIMASVIPYADLWKLLRRLDYDCDLLVENPRGKHNTVRIGQHPSGSRITLADYPPGQFVRDEILFIVKIELGVTARPLRC